MGKESTAAKRIRRRLQLFAILTFVFFGFFFVVDLLQEFARSADPSAPAIVEHDTFPTVPAGFHLFTFLIFLSLIEPKRYFLPLTFTLIYAGLLVFSIFYRVGVEQPIGDSTNWYIQRLYANIWLWDYVGAVFIVIMLASIFSIRRRGHRHRVHHDPTPRS